MTYSELQQKYAAGAQPKNLDGFYQGKLEALYPKTPIEQIGNIVFKIWLPWYGKELDSRKAEGLNHVPAFLESIVHARYGSSTIIGVDKSDLRVFPFKTFETKGLKDNLKILQLSYDLPENPQGIRNIVDELVEIRPGEYLGKAYTREKDDLRLLAFFSLRK